ncbi:MAG: cation transporter [Neisseria sp.]|nr:cation transporter [Neisseria sp.]
MACTGTHCIQDKVSPAYRNILIGALFINGAMFLLESLMSAKAGSVSLFADSLDFLGDAANYGISLFVLSKSLKTRAKASLIKGGTMLIFGVAVLFSTLYAYWQGNLPNHSEMGAVGILALLANVGTAWMLYRHKDGDSNRQSVWLCSRNDAIGNIAVVLAAVAVYFTGSNLPDLVVALAMALLAIQAAWVVMKQAWAELR